MKEKSMVSFAGGRVYTLEADWETEHLAWHPHPSFPGVFLKHLLLGESSQGKFSAHLVRVAAGCEIGEHTHPGKWEIHEVLRGQGECVMPEKSIPYQAGVCALIPEDHLHRVVAREEDLFLLAKFVPALL